MDFKENIQHQITDGLKSAFILDKDIYIETSTKPIRLTITKCSKWMDSSKADNAEPAAEKKEAAEAIINLFSCEAFFHKKELYLGFRSDISNKFNQVHIKFVSPRNKIERPQQVNETSRNLIDKAILSTPTEEEIKEIEDFLMNLPPRREMVEPLKPWPMVLVEYLAYGGHAREGNRVDIICKITADSLYITEPNEPWYLIPRLINIPLVDYIHLIYNYESAIDTDFKPHWTTEQNMIHVAFIRFLEGLMRQNHIHMDKQFV